MSNIGYYRYKVSDAIEGEQTVKFFKSGALLKTCTIIAKKFCLNYRLIKYLDSNGQYRFFPFNNRWQQTDKPTLIGKVNKFVTSILDSQSEAANIGYKNERRISLVAEQVSLEELEKLQDIFVSPRVYLYVGQHGYDRIQDWIQVSITGDGIGRPRKTNFKKFAIDVILPEYYAITKI
jgi:hypothetical protein